jgi:flagellar biosynthesis GTPase FlhF
MKIKRLHFDSIKEGMKRIKEEYGPDAIIIDMKERRSASAKDFEMVIAIEEEGSKDGYAGDLMRKIDEITGVVKSLSDRMFSMETEAVGHRVDGLPVALRDLHKKMVSNGFDGRLAYSIILDVFKETGNFAKDIQKADFFLKRALSRRIPVGQLNGHNGILILGPSGSGKTSTTKKIAKYLLEREEPVSIIAFDPSRKDRYNEYMMFSESTGVPFYFTATEEDLLFVMERDTRKKIIDMTGQVQLQKRVAERLKDTQKLVLAPAWARETKVREYCEQFGDAHISGIIITKLDEENTLGHICDYIMDMAKPVFFFTTGMDVRDLVVADHEIFYTILLRENLWRSEEGRR